MDEPGFRKFIAERIIEALMGNFPDETRQIQKSSINYISGKFSTTLFTPISAFVLPK
jgi:hypothetical protein